MPVSDTPSVIAAPAQPDAPTRPKATKQVAITRDCFYVPAEVLEPYFSGAARAEDIDLSPFRRTMTFFVDQVEENHPDTAPDGC
jgi:hypothetical protein